jgi:NTE family protein
MTPTPPKNGLLMVGGGARAAYQAGVLRSLAKSFPTLNFPILTGVSAGAINAASLANAADDFPHAVERTVAYWESITIDQVFRSELHAPGLDMLKWLYRMAAGRVHHLEPLRGMVDTSPLRHFLRNGLSTPDGILHGVQANLKTGRLSALGITTDKYPSGRSTTWIQGNNLQPWHKAERCGRLTTLTVEHIMASTALPLVFPAVHLDDGWYGDGGMRLTAPLSPMVHLGAEKILAISTLVGPRGFETNPADQSYPPPAAVLSVLLDSVFLDMLDGDAMKMQQLNQLIAVNPQSKEFGLRHVDVFVMRPSVDLGALAREFESELPKLLRRVLRSMGGTETKHSDAIATLLFQPRYIQKLIEIGERDGQRRRDELATFFGLEAAGSAPRFSAVGHKINGVNGHSTAAELGRRDHASTERTGTDR